jgi:predicted PolB exonuclease-like 3'-5' exonuclease
MARLVYDIETVGLPQDVLKSLYKEPTFEEFADSCDQRWKPETKAAKYAEAKADGWNKFVSRAALSPITGQVLAIGFKSEKASVVTGTDGESEEELLIGFWDIVRKYKENGHLIGFNSDGFDLPFLIRRSWYHGIAIPESVVPVASRYFPPMFIDLMKVWGFRSNEFVSLSTLCAFFGLGAKPDGVNGAMFATLWNGNDESKQQAIAYLVNDLDLTYKLAERMGVI